jgi:hypothetical protein
MPFWENGLRIKPRSLMIAGETQLQNTRLRYEF